MSNRTLTDIGIALCVVGIIAALLGRNWVAALWALAAMGHALHVRVLQRRAAEGHK